MTDDASAHDRPVDPFADLDADVGLPRVAGLWLSPDGRRLVVGVGTPDRRGAGYVTALWEVDPEGRRPARRLTRSDQGESGAAFTPSGELLFVSERPEPDREGEETIASLWLQPAAGGDARVVASLPGGVRVVGGPLASWNAWSWRWNPWLAVAQGYAVLLPDPALSTGYGLDFIRRGWGAWGGTPYSDLLSLTDAAEAHVDVDGERTAAMGGSFGGYMVNWVAGTRTASRRWSRTRPSGRSTRPRPPGMRRSTGSA